MRIRGERLGRSLVIGWAQKNGVDLPCTCCKCPVQLCEHHRHEMEDGEDGEEDDDDEDEEKLYDGAIDFDEEDEDEVIDFVDGVEPDVFEDSEEE